MSNLRERVLRCIRRMQQEGWTIAPGRYINRTTSCACVLGAVSLCEDLNVDPDSSFFNGTVRNLRDPITPLVEEHLDCTANELDSLEAGFELWDLETAIHEARDGISETTIQNGFDHDAYHLGRFVRRCADGEQPWPWDEGADDLAP